MPRARKKTKTGKQIVAAMIRTAEKLGLPKLADELRRILATMPDK
jgi:hypothetical protein